MLGVFLWMDAVGCGGARMRFGARRDDPINGRQANPARSPLDRCAIDAARSPVESMIVTPADLSAALLDIVTAIVDRRRAAGADIGDVTVTIDDVPLERPKNREHGDWASNVAMRLAKRLGANPRELAAEIAEAAASIEGVASAEVAGPGFINFRLDAAAAGQLAKTIVEAGDEYGRGHLYDGLTVNLEFVSANPTGPIHMGGVRWAAVGDSLARILQAEGADVTREYYFNDHGSQIDRFARSLLAAYLGEPTPEDGYGGAYIGDIAAAGRRAATTATSPTCRARSSRRCSARSAPS